MVEIIIQTKYKGWRKKIANEFLYIEIVTVCFVVGSGRDAWS